MSIETDVATILERINTQEATLQSRRIDEASKIVDDLVRKGIVEGPSYRLAPTTAVPHRLTGITKNKF